MKILICGLGSIGSRHLNNLITLGLSPEDIAVFRTKKGTPSFGDQTLAKHGNKNPVFYDLNEALEKHQPKIAFITNPTALHIPVALKCAKAGCDLFIEKPISHTLQGIDELIEIVKQKQLITYVGCQLRFHRLLKHIRQWLGNKRIGKIICVHAEMAERVTDWHPWENYKISYACRKDLGGGAILTQIHEIDYLYWLFGKPIWVFAAGGELGNLRIEVEDTVKIIMQFPQKNIASLHLDYLKRPPQRFLEITGTEGRIHWDFFEKKARLLLLDGRVITEKEPNGYEKNNMFVAELRHFLKCVRKRKKTSNDIQQGKDVLEICLAAKSSMRTLKPKYLNI